MTSVDKEPSFKARGLKWNTAATWLGLFFSSVLAWQVWQGRIDAENSAAANRVKLDFIAEQNSKTLGEHTTHLQQLDARMGRAETRLDDWSGTPRPFNRRSE